MKRSNWVSVTMMSLGGLIGCLAAGDRSRSRHLARSQSPVRTASEGTPRVLPRPDFKFKGKVGKTYKDSDPPQFPQPVQGAQRRTEHRVDLAR